MNSPSHHDKTAFDRQAAANKERALEFTPAMLESFIPGSVTVTRLENLASGAGASNGIVLFDAIRDGVAEELVLRYATPTPLIKQKRFPDEFQTMTAAAAAGLPVPAVRWLDAEGRILGRPSCIVDRVQGQSPPASLFTDGILARATPQDRHRMMLSAAEAHGRLRAAAIPPDAVPHLTERGGDQGATAIEREYAWWMEEARLANPAPEKLALLARARKKMLANQPTGLYPENLCHGDAQFANMLFHNHQLVAMLDWELAYLGHNEADLALLIIFSETLKPTDTPFEGIPTEAEYIAAYEAAAGTSVVALDYFKAFCIMKIATAMVFGADTMPGAEELWLHYSAMYQDALELL